jgi:hypothetical protein
MPTANFRRKEMDIIALSANGQIASLEKQFNLFSSHSITGGKG